MKVVGLVSGGKDSVYNLIQCSNKGHEIVALANLCPIDNSTVELDSYMYQTVGHEIIGLYSQCTGLPVYRRKTMGLAKNQDLDYMPTDLDETEDLLALLSYIKKDLPDIEAVSSGAIASQYQRARVENVCARLGLVSLAYLWSQPQKQLLHDMVTSGIQAILIKVAALGLNSSHLNKTIEEMEPILNGLYNKFGLHHCGEGGEYETLTLDSPLFIYASLRIHDYEIVKLQGDVSVIKLKKFAILPKREPVPDKNVIEVPLNYMQHGKN